MHESDDKLITLIWNYMEIQTSLGHADAIVVGGSTDGGVASYAAELYAMGFAPTIVFSGQQQPGMDTTEADFLADIARDHGVPESAILRERQAKNAGENIRMAEAMLAENGIQPKKVILIHKPYMTRPFLATAEAQWSDPKPTFIVRHEPISLPEYSLKRGKGEVIRYTLGDFQRMRTYAKKGFQSPQEIPENVQEAYDTLLWRGHQSR